MIKLFKTIFLILLSSCGSSRFVEYPNEASQDSINLKGDCALLLDAYKTTIMPLVENTCLECHSKKGQLDLGFIEGDHKKNSESFKRLNKGDLSKLLSKLNNEIPHKGLDVVDVDDERNISLFFGVNELCQKL